MSKEAIEQYHSELRDRRMGIPSSVNGEASFIEAKPPFYADARLLSESALEVFNKLPETHPPYGLAYPDGNPVKTLMDGESPWISLFYGLRSTGRFVMEEAIPGTTVCPYHEVLQAHLGSTVPELRPMDHNLYGLDTLRAVSTPGAELNASLFVSLIRRLPALRTLHGDSSDLEDFSRASVAILREPLAHPVARAAGFVYSLGSITQLLQPSFFADELALNFTHVETVSGRNRLNWSKPTEDLTLLQGVYVSDRVNGSELDANDQKTYYPRGTRLGDIDVESGEPTLGCPGNKLAFAMWDRLVDVALAESLWDRPD